LGQAGSRCDVERAAEEVNLADFIRTLPGGSKKKYASALDALNRPEQLISFARALAHDPKILILRRSHLERGHRNRIPRPRRPESHGRRRTSLIIAHRLSTIQRADKIIVMHKGQVREMGSHQQLPPSAVFTGSCISSSTKTRRSMWRGRPRTRRGSGRAGTTKRVTGRAKLLRARVSVCTLQSLLRAVPG